MLLVFLLWFSFFSMFFARISFDIFSFWFDIRFSWFTNLASIRPYLYICKSPFGHFTFLMSAATYSPTFAVPSAVSVLTVVFGMGTGVSPIRIATDNDVDCFAIKS